MQYHIANKLLLRIRHNIQLDIKRMREQIDTHKKEAVKICEDIREIASDIKKISYRSSTPTPCHE